MVKKPIRFMSNSPEVLKVLNRQCTDIGKCKGERHRHVMLVEVQAVCEGVARQKTIHEAGLRSMMPFHIE